MDKQQKYKLKLAMRRIDNLFADIWRKSNPARRDFNANGPECLSMIKWYRIWKAVTALCILMNAACAIFGSRLIIELWGKDSFLFWMVSWLVVCLQGLLLFWAHYELGKGKPTERKIPGKAAYELAASWKMFRSQFKNTGMHASIKNWIVSLNRDMDDQEEVTGFFVYILNQKADMILKLEAEGKEDKKKPVRLNMSLIYDLGKQLGLNLPEFESFFPEETAWNLRKQPGNRPG